MNPLSNFRILIMAGGTGGHVFPGIAVAENLRKEGHDVLWLGTKQGLEASLVPAKNFPIRYLSITGIRRKDFKTLCLAPFLLIKALYQAKQIIQSYKPNVVLGMGGFVTGPGGIMAWLLGYPLIIHEQNAIAGFTNRILARLAKHILEGFPNSFPTKIKAEWVGNPVRQDLSTIPAPDIRYALDNKKNNDIKKSIRLLVIGGSQGASFLNQLLPETFAIVQKQKNENIEVWHQTGAAQQEVTKLNYQKKEVKARVDAFIDNMSEAYQWADLVICRAGALTVSELAMVGIGSILVPFPFAVDDHQTYNGRFLEKVGAAKIFAQANLNPAILADEIIHISNDPNKLRLMAIAAQQVAKPNALTQVTKRCIEVSGEFKSKFKSKSKPR